MKLNLTQGQRIIVALLYLAVLSLIFNFLGGNFKNLIWNSGLDSSIWFYAGAFMIILGTYIVEPYFTKPSDAIANSTAILIALLGLSAKKDFIAYIFIFYYALSILCLSIFTIFLKDAKHAFWTTISKSTYWIVETFGASKIIFSIVYLSASYSYFALENKILPFISILAFWICLTFFDIIGIFVKEISKFINFIKNRDGIELGQAIGCENPLLYKIEVDFSRHRPCSVSYGDIVAIETSMNVGSIGMIINTKYLLHKKWLSVYLFQDDNGEVLKIDLRSKKLTADSKSIFQKDNLAFQVDKKELEEQTQKIIEDNFLYKNRNDFIGYVSSGSNINTINFAILKDLADSEQKISEGTILKTKIYDSETLYQVIDGNTKEEHLENFDTHGYIIGIARKLGKYIYSSKDLDICKWMPDIYSPLFFAFSGAVAPERIKEISKNSIGRLPETDLEIPIKDLDAIVTHNTAILGILGIGKSCLAFELIKRIIDNKTKVFCIDITNQYNSEQGLLSYINTGVDFDLPAAIKTGLKTTKDERTRVIEGNPQASGNIQDYFKAMDDDIKSFIEGDSRIKIYNPDLHPISKGVAYKNTSLEDLTVAEKTRVIAERVFIYAKNSGTSDKAKYLLVFEEAHSLVPEWNSTANEGDKSATNGTAKVILQGRKYGLGSLVITQRTANVSKSILNQCNTIFALRVFDDTGKNFLGNYIGEDYSNTLPTLEERHAIAVGKGLKLKQPVIIQLNNQDDVIEQLCSKIVPLQE